MAASAPELYALMDGLPVGAWVAISTEKVCVLAYGDDADAVVEEAILKGDAHPLIARVPDPDVAWFFPCAR